MKALSSQSFLINSPTNKILVKKAIARGLKFRKSDSLAFMAMVFEPVQEKTNNLVSDHDRHKTGCTVTEGGKRLEILDLASRGMYYTVRVAKTKVRICTSENKSADQLCSNCTADLRICFRSCR